MARTYTLGKRAERKEETRRRIAEAALELHSTIGPARATVSAIAARAGVQRHTFYAHFPEMESLFWACSGLHVERHPLPDPADWRSIEEPLQRMRVGLAELYAYYERDESLLANVFGEAPRDDVIVRERLLDPIDRMRDELASAFPAQGKEHARLLAALELVLDFSTWQLLVRRRGLSRNDAVELAARLVACAAA